MINAKATAADLKQSRAKMLEEVDFFKETLKTYAAYDTQLLEVDHGPIAAGMRSSGSNPRRSACRLVNISTNGQVSPPRRVPADRMLDKQLEPFETAAGRRIAAALALLGVPRVAKRIKDAEVAAHRGRAAACRFCRCFRQSLGLILEIRNTHATLAMLAGQIAGNQGERGPV